MFWTTKILDYLKLKETKRFRRWEVVKSHSRYGICSYKSLMNLAQFEGFDANNTYGKDYSFI